MKIERWKNWNPYERITIGEDDLGKPVEKKYICNYCNRTVDVKISDDEYFCNNCQISIIISTEDIRTAQDIQVPEGPAEETLVSTTPGTNYDGVAIKKKVQPKGGFKALRDKGLRITDYQEYNPR